MNNIQGGRKFEVTGDREVSDVIQYKHSGKKFEVTGDRGRWDENRCERHSGRRDEVTGECGDNDVS